jgi:hypothetical protein
MPAMRYALVLLILGCGGTSPSMPVPDGGATTADGSGAADVAPADGAESAADARAPDVAPSVPGAPVTQPGVGGLGACAGKTLGQVIAAVHQQMPALADITVIEGMDPNLGGDGNRIYAFAHDDGFRLVFKRGSGDCPSGCIDNEYWYFATDERCVPAPVGHYLATYMSGGNCLKVEGTPLWGRPRAVDPAVVCGADNSPQNITGTYKLTGTGTRTACTEKAAAQPQERVSLALTVVVFQMPGNLSQGTVTVVGTGNSRLDGVPLPGQFTRRRVSASREGNGASMCLDQTQASVELDLESGTTGTLKFFEARALACPGDAICKGQLDLRLGLSP